MNKRIKNSARLVGEVVAKYPTDKVTIVTIKTTKETEKGKRVSFPKAVCFEKTKDQTKDINIGDFVIADCTIQANIRDEKIENQAMRTVAVNRIFKVDPNSENYHSVNAFRFFCRVIRINRVAENVAIARIFFFTNRAHYMTVVFKNDDVAVVDAFCNIAPEDRVILNGSIDTSKFKRKDGSIKYTEECVARSFLKLQKRNAAPVGENEEAAE